MILIIIITLSLLSYISGYLSNIKYREFKYNNKDLIINKQSKIYLTDQIDQITPLVVDINTQADGFIEGLTSSFSSRLIGTIVGNVLAAFLLKYLSDNLWNFLTNKFNNNNNKFSSTSNDIVTRNNQKESSEVNNKDIPLNAWFTLLLCIGLDLVGDSSFFIPGFGEIEDIAWAPISAFILSNIFGSNVITTLDFAKEVLPGTDIIPLAVFAWVLKYKYPDSQLTKLLGISTESNSTISNNISKETIENLIKVVKKKDSVDT